MYRIKSFNNAHEFQELFGVQEHGNGVKSRRNRILLALLKHKPIWEWCREHDDWSLLAVKSMAEMKQLLTQKLIEAGNDEGLDYEVNLNKNIYHSNIYETDEYKGIPEDATIGFVRYINHTNNNGVYKMRAGKFFGKIINETTLGQALPKQVKTWLCEEFSVDWQVFCAGTLPEFELYVDDDFERIYSSSDCVGNFGSCMVDKDLHYFYSNSVKAKAAYLTNKENMVIARCIIFTEVFDEENIVWRLAERQYATDGNEILKRALVDALIKADKIDGYKAVGADCGSSRNFVDNAGTPLSHKQFHIECNLEYDDALSYQDSFKYYSMTDQVAYNYTGACYGYRLDTTNGNLEDNDDDEMPYDSWHDRDADEVTTVFYHGGEETCDVEDLDDFEYFDDEYYHAEDDLDYCPHCEERMLSPEYYDNDLYYSELTGQYYCCEKCREEAEEKFKREQEQKSETRQNQDAEVKEEALIAV